MKQQLNEVFGASQRIAIVLPEHPSVDSSATAAALLYALQAQGKTVLVASSGSLPDELTFLAEPFVLTPQLGSSAQLEIVVATTQGPLDELSYQVEADGVHIFLRPKTGSFTASDVAVHEAAAKLDLMVVVGARSPEDLGALYQQYAEVFFNTPKVVFDVSPDNSYFGTVHAIDVTASSVGEIVADWLFEAHPDWLNPSVATALLGAITASTHSFQSVRTTPRALSLAAELVTLGAQQQDVVRSLYKTKPFSLLKLWGRALARVQYIDNRSLLYSSLTHGDYTKTGTSSALAVDVLEELLDNSAGSQIVALLAEEDKGVRVVLATLPHIRVEPIVQQLGGDIKTTSTRGLYTETIVSLPDVDPQQAEKRLLESTQPR